MPFDPDETQEVEVIRPAAPRLITALDAGDPKNAGLQDGYFSSSVVLHITVSERGMVTLTAYDWERSMYAPGQYAVRVELETV